jgi:hypothetical protein
MLILYLTKYSCCHACLVTIDGSGLITGFVVLLTYSRF